MGIFAVDKLIFENFLIFLLRVLLLHHATGMETRKFTCGTCQIPLAGSDLYVCNIHVIVIRRDV